MRTREYIPVSLLVIAITLPIAVRAGDAADAMCLANWDYSVECTHGKEVEKDGKKVIGGKDCVCMETPPGCSAPVTGVCVSAIKCSDVKTCEGKAPQKPDVPSSGGQPPSLPKIPEGGGGGGSPETPPKVEPDQTKPADTLQNQSLIGSALNYFDQSYLSSPQLQPGNIQPTDAIQTGGSFAPDFLTSTEPGTLEGGLPPGSYAFPGNPPGEVPTAASPGLDTSQISQLQASQGFQPGESAPSSGVGQNSFQPTSPSTFSSANGELPPAGQDCSIGCEVATAVGNVADALQQGAEDLLGQDWTKVQNDLGNALGLPQNAQLFSPNGPPQLPNSNGETGPTQANTAQDYFAAPDSKLTSQPEQPPVGPESKPVTATLYYPCGGGIEGGCLGNHDNLLSKTTPTIAVPDNSPLKYGDIVKLTNQVNGQSEYAVVGDRCPGCANTSPGGGPGVDLTPVAARGLGLNDTGSVTYAPVTSAASYSQGVAMVNALNSGSAQLAASPWSGPSATFASLPSSSFDSGASVASPFPTADSYASGIANLALNQFSTPPPVDTSFSQPQSPSSQGLADLFGGDYGPKIDSGPVGPFPPEQNISQGPQPDVTANQNSYLGNQLPSNLSQGPQPDVTADQNSHLGNQLPGQNVSQGPQPDVTADQNSHLGNQLPSNLSQGPQPDVTADQNSHLGNQLPAPEQNVSQGPQPDVTADQNSHLGNQLPSNISQGPQPDVTADQNSHLGNQLWTPQNISQGPQPDVTENQNSYLGNQLWTEQNISQGPQQDVTADQNSHLGNQLPGQNVSQGPQPNVADGGYPPGASPNDNLVQNDYLKALNGWTVASQPAPETGSGSTFQPPDTSIKPVENGGELPPAAPEPAHPDFSDVKVEPPAPGTTPTFDQKEAGAPRSSFEPAAGLKQGQPSSLPALQPNNPYAGYNPAGYKGNSVVDYMSSIGNDVSKATRSALAAAYGIENYIGSAVQNSQLLRTLRGF